MVTSRVRIGMHSSFKEHIKLNMYLIVLRRFYRWIDKSETLQIFNHETLNFILKPEHYLHVLAYYACLYHRNNKSSIMLLYLLMIKSLILNIISINIEVKNLKSDSTKVNICSDFYMYFIFHSWDWLMTAKLNDIF